MEKVLEITSPTKSYEKDLHSEEPFIRSMYEDLERRIEEFEDDYIQSKQKVQVSDFITVTVVMGIITIAAFFI